MKQQKIEPQNVTKPIQLLAAWLVGLILINSTFLGAAKVITQPTWAAGFLVIAAIINVPIFLYLIYSLQTKFRAELQEDTYYAKHLEKITGQVSKPSSQNESFLNALKSIQTSNNNQFEEINKNLEDLSNALSEESISKDKTENLLEKITEAKTSLHQIEKNKIKKSTTIFVNDLIPEFKSIIQLLIESNFKISDTFGSTSVDKVPPKTLTISYSKDTNKLVLKEIYLLLKPFKFNRIDFNEENIENDYSTIYIGSYIDTLSDSIQSTLIDNSIEEMLLNDNISQDQFNKYISLAYV